jgi:endonuclease V-like protein UPF0215 family
VSNHQGAHKMQKKYHNVRYGNNSISAKRAKRIVKAAAKYSGKCPEKN